MHTWIYKLFKQNQFFLFLKKRIPGAIEINWAQQCSSKLIPSWAFIWPRLGLSSAQLRMSYDYRYKLLRASSSMHFEVSKVECTLCIQLSTWFNALFPYEIDICITYFHCCFSMVHLCCFLTTLMIHFKSPSGVLINQLSISSVTIHYHHYLIRNNVQVETWFSF